MKAWEAFLVQLEKDLGVATVHKWLKPLSIIQFDACNLYLEAKDSFQVLWFEEHIRPRITSQFINNNNKKIKVHLSVANPDKNKTPKKKSPASAKSDSSKSKAPSIAPFALSFDLLDSQCALDNFVVNEHNILVHKLLSKLIAEPTELAGYNPIYIQGVTGTGKSHLLTATALALREKGLNVIYTRAETFTTHVVTAIRAGEMSIFRQTYRSSDVLIIDDVHIFSKKHATQEELFHTFNTLHVAGKQIILSANCSPAELQMIEPRLVSRFEWGIVLTLEPLQKEEIKTVLLEKMSQLKFSLNSKVVDYLLETFNGTKAITKALQTLILRMHLKEDNGHLSSTQFSTLQVKHMLSDLIHDEEQSALTPHKVVQLVAEHFGIRSEDVLGKAQTRDCVLPRQLAMYFCRLTLKMTYPKIGELFNKDHSTVMSSVKAIQKALDLNDTSVFPAYNSISKKIKV